MKKAVSISCKNLKDDELLVRTLRSKRVEKRVTLKLLNYLVEVDTRRLYTTVNARSSLFEYLVSDLGLSHAAASDRVNAVRLMREVPEVKEHLETGQLSVTTAAQIQRFANLEQKANAKGKNISAEAKKEVVDACLGQSKREVEKTLLERQSDPARKLTEEKVRLVTSARSELRFSVEEKTILKLQQLKELIGNQSLETIFDSALDSFLFNEQKKRGVIISTDKSKKSIQVNSDLSGKSKKPLHANSLSSVSLANSDRSDRSSKPKKSSPINPSRPADLKETAFSQAEMKRSKAPQAKPVKSQPINAERAKTQQAEAELMKAEKTKAQRAKTQLIDAEQTETQQTKTQPVNGQQTETQLKSRFIPIDLKRVIFARSKGQCEHVDPRTGFRCRSRFRLQIDHLRPLALGGFTESSNLWHLCSAHNLRMATEAGLWRQHKQSQMHS